MIIIIYAIAKNEAQFAERFMSSCAGADGVYVLDTGSTDGTPELLCPGVLTPRARLARKQQY